jgi:glutamate 5-kinase
VTESVAPTSLRATLSDPKAARTLLSNARRVIIKIGSRLLATRPTLIQELARQLSSPSHPTGRDFLIVSSGAIALGWAKLGYPKRPTNMDKLQASAAVGQSELMFRYVTEFAGHGKTAAQVLLTHSDLASRRRLLNAQQALNALFAAGAIPIVNENDTVSTDEIAFGDNDQLASMVCSLTSADALFLLTDVSGVLDPDGKRIPLMVTESVVGDRPSANSFGTGGIGSKVGAARKASRSGASVVIASAAEENVIVRLLQGEDLGTLFTPDPNALKARKHWIAYTLRPRGVIMINEGAASVLRLGNSSLLPVGILGVRGQFSANEAVQLCTPDGTEVARGLSRMGVSEVARVAGKTKEEVTERLGLGDAVVVHIDDLVVSSP